jgi:hypothetical protein
MALVKPGVINLPSWMVEKAKASRDEILSLGIITDLRISDKLIEVDYPEAELVHVHEQSGTKLYYKRAPLTLYIKRDHEDCKYHSIGMALFLHGIYARAWYKNESCKEALAGLWAHPHVRTPEYLCTNDWGQHFVTCITKQDFIQFVQLFGMFFNTAHDTSQYYNAENAYGKGRKPFKTEEIPGWKEKQAELKRRQEEEQKRQAEIYQRDQEQRRQDLARREAELAAQRKRMAEEQRKRDEEALKNHPVYGQLYLQLEEFEERKKLQEELVQKNHHLEDPYAEAAKAMAVEPGPPVFTQADYLAQIMEMEELERQARQSLGLSLEVEPDVPVQTEAPRPRRKDRRPQERVEAAFQQETAPPAKQTTPGPQWKTVTEMVDGIPVQKVVWT